MRDLLAFFLVTLALTAAVAGTGEREVRGRISVYWPGDSTGTGRVLACDRPGRRRFYRSGSWHVAVRGWRTLCGRTLRICSEVTGKCVRAPVLDSGPWGAYWGPLRNAKREGRYVVWTKRLPLGGIWKRRGHVDVSRAVWVALGRPPFLSRVRVYYPRRGRV